MPTFCYAWHYTLQGSAKMLLLRFIVMYTDKFTFWFVVDVVSVGKTCNSHGNYCILTDIVETKPDSHHIAGNSGHPNLNSLNTKTHKTRQTSLLECFILIKEATCIKTANVCWNEIKKRKKYNRLGHRCLIVLIWPACSTDPWLSTVACSLLSIQKMLCG